MKTIFKLPTKIVSKVMARNDKKVKSKLPKIEGVNQYLSYNYASKDKKDFRKFNLYKPKIESVDLPLIIDIHGGGWVYGDKELNDNYAMYLASKGYNVVTFSYRLLTDTNLKGMVQDIFAFLNYLYKNKGKYEISFDDVMISGDSAGGHLALLTLAINQNKFLLDAYEVEPFTFNVDFLVLEHQVPYIDHIFNETNFINKILNKEMRNSFYKPLDKKGLIIKQYANLNDFIKLAKYPPILCVSGDKDELKPFYDRSLKEFDENGVIYESKVYENMFHVFQVLNFDLPESEEFNDYSLQRFEEIIKSKGDKAYE